MRALFEAFRRPDVVLHWEPTCVVPDDDGEVVRGAAPIDEAARAQLREQQIARMLAEASR